MDVVERQAATIIPETKAQRAEAMEIADALVSIKARLGSLGMFTTMHALDEATRAIGYEIAEKYHRKA